MLERRVQERFYAKATSPRDLPWHRDDEDDFLAAVVRKRRRPGKALDLGCGSGVFSVQLARHGYEVTGLDFIPRAIDMAKARARTEGVEVNWVNADLLTWDHRDQYDLVFDSGCLHSLIGNDPGKYKKQLLNWLRPGGDYVLAHWGRRNLRDWRPIGPKRRTRRELAAQFSPELKEVACSEEVMTGIPFPFGPTVMGVRIWFERAR